MQTAQAVAPADSSLSAQSKPKKPKKISKFSKRKVDKAYYWMTVPAALLVVAFLYWPFIQGAAYSFTNSQGYGEFKWIGFKNYGAMFSDSRVRNAYLFTIIIALIITIGTNLLALLISVMLNGKIAFKNGFRAVFFIPFTLAMLVIGYVFKYLFMVPIPALGQSLHISWLSTSMLTNPQLAWFPIAFLSIWQGVAYTTLIYLAGLQTIDAELYEAASIDGVNTWQRFWRITFPLIGPFVTINMVLSLKNSLGIFDQIVALTNGGPDSKTESVSYLIFTNGLGNGEYSYQMANAVVFFIVLAIFAFVQLNFFGSKEKV
ncbi:carbohydrate ABC transporter permease [Bifidobacterium subtile]|jgi:raffinose/stachyose/melibiose transport system permease protein|uniref:Sugar ABC transporter permease n=1 Tax=Bifidobacterium subtile TaxID=77635 RepID=A0A087E781_9BIFI|nr:sugar ABC transporter permease [Bifidobacterium subtile]KFJ03632.1 sugar ABC transporter permease [Bifidobacterium subtile]QOL36281.1 sugar ABC transporter permease [Bifidobacterium subtile]